MTAILTVWALASILMFFLFFVVPNVDNQPNKKTRTATVPVTNRKKAIAA